MMPEEPAARIWIPAATMTESQRELGRSRGLGSTFKWRATKEKGELRLDLAVSEYLRIPLEEAALLIDFGSVYVQGRIERTPSRIVTAGEEISAAIPSYGTRKFYDLDPTRIVFRDRFLLAYDKEAGIPSQQTPFDAYNNVYAGIRRYLEKEGTANPYTAIHHRLDRETSGVLLFTLHRQANAGLSRTFQERRIRKEYLAWVAGSPEKENWTVDLDIAKVGGRYRAVDPGAGKKAQTSFRVLHRGQSRSLLLITPLTGRTHQIRAHLAAAGHPVAGDSAYGAKQDARLYLHALRLSLLHPVLPTALILEAPPQTDWNLPDGLKDLH